MEAPRSEPSGSQRVRRNLEPLWLFVVLGLLAADVLWPPTAPVAIPPDAGGARVDRLSGAPEALAGPRDLTTMNARELRQLPGVGDGRARAMVVARWEHGRRSPSLRVDEVRGIGPVTEARI